MWHFVALNRVPIAVTLAVVTGLVTVIMWFRAKKVSAMDARRFLDHKILGLIKGSYVIYVLGLVAILFYGYDQGKRTQMNCEEMRQICHSLMKGQSSSGVTVLPPDNVVIDDSARPTRPHPGHVEKKPAPPPLPVIVPATKPGKYKAITLPNGDVQVVPE